MARKRSKRGKARHAVPTSVQTPAIPEIPKVNLGASEAAAFDRRMAIQTTLRRVVEFASDLPSNTGAAIRRHSGNSVAFLMHCQTASDAAELKEILDGLMRTYGPKVEDDDADTGSPAEA